MFFRKLPFRGDELHILRGNDRLPRVSFRISGENRTVIAHLFEICRLNSINPLANLSDTLARISNGHSNNQIFLVLWPLASGQSNIAAKPAI